VAKDRVRGSHLKKAIKTHRREKASRSSSPNDPGLSNGPITTARTDDDHDVAPAKPESTGKLYLLQYYDPASYNNSTNDMNDSGNSDSYIRAGDSDPYHILDMPDPGSYAIFIELSPTNTFLYIPETKDVDGDDNHDASASPGLVRPSHYSIACYTNMRPELRGDLIDGLVGERDIKAEDVGIIRGVIGGLEMEKGMESFDWARGALRACEDRGLLRESVASCL
jgi:hypothetical protein